MEQTAGHCRVEKQDCPQDGCAHHARGIGKEVGEDADRDGVWKTEII